MGISQMLSRRAQQASKAAGGQGADSATRTIPSTTPLPARRAASAPQAGSGHHFSQISILDPSGARTNDSLAAPSIASAAPAIQRDALETSPPSGAVPETSPPSGTAPEDFQPPPAVSELLQMKSAGPQGSALEGGVHSMESRLSGKRGGGSALPADTRAYMEPRLGFDFSQVRIHADSEAAHMNREVGAHAFAYGQDVYFADNKFDPGSTEGKRLLAHELTHVVQQSGGVQTKSLQTKLTVSQPGDRYEQEADRVADAVVAMPASTAAPATAPAATAGPASVQRDQAPTGGAPAVVSDLLQMKLDPVQASTGGQIVQAKCAACEEEEREQAAVMTKQTPEAQIQTKADAGGYSRAAVAITQSAPQSVQRHLFGGDCVAEYWNLAAATTAAVAAGATGIAALLAPDPTTLTKWAAAGLIVAVISGIAWMINAIIALINCKEALNRPSDHDEIERLRQRLEQLERTQRRLEEMRGGGSGGHSSRERSSNESESLLSGGPQPSYGSTQMV